MAQDSASTPWRDVWDTVRAILIAIIVALLIRQFVVETYQVNGVSMEPNLQNGERLLVNKFIYRFTTPHAGQIVIFHPPVPGVTVDYVKRVIAVAGQTFQMKQGQVYINGQLQAEPWEPQSWRDNFTGSQYVGGQYGNCPSPALQVNTHPIVIPAGHIWVLGDHRDDSIDSRCFGPVPISSVRGQAMLIWWPFPDFRAL